MSNLILSVRRLEVEDAPRLSDWLYSQPIDHVRFFHPFAFDPMTIRHRLEDAHQDVYLEMEVADHTAGLVLLRGWDEGFLIPCYGILVDHQHLRQGLGRESLSLARKIAAGKGAPSLMLKVHPENTAAIALYESDGWWFSATEPKSGNLIYRTGVAGE